MDTYDKIAEKAGELFLTHGIRSVTMDHLATHLGLAKKTIYKYFENKRELVGNFVIKETTMHRNNCMMLTNANNDALLRLFFTMIYIQQFYFKLTRPNIDTLEKYYHEAYMILKRHQQEFLFNAIKNTIEEGVELHLYQRDFNIDTMSRFFLENVAIILGNRASSLVEFNPTDHESILGHMISGIATSTGLAKIKCYKSQHLFTSFTQTLTRPYWED